MAPSKKTLKKSSKLRVKKKGSKATTRSSKLNSRPGVVIRKRPTQLGLALAKKKRKAAKANPSLSTPPFVPLRRSVRTPRMLKDLENEAQVETMGEDDEPPPSSLLSSPEEITFNTKPSLIEARHYYGEKPKKEQTPTALSSSTPSPSSHWSSSIEELLDPGNSPKLDAMLNVHFRPRNSKSDLTEKFKRGLKLNGIVFRLFRSKYEVYTWTACIWGPDFQLLSQIAERIGSCVVREHQNRFYLLRTMQKGYSKDFADVTLKILLNLQKPRLIKRNIWSYHEKGDLTERTWFLTEDEVKGG